MGYSCAVCGKPHEGLPDLGIDRPDPWWGVPEPERERRIRLTPDHCVIDERDYFIRGVLSLPIVGSDRSFGFGVWVSQKKENFEKYLERPEDRGIGPFFGWLSTRIAFYSPDTFLLKTMAHFRGGGLRPWIELEPTDHPLSLDQRNGISEERAWEIVHWSIAGA